MGKKSRRKCPNKNSPGTENAATGQVPSLVDHSTPGPNPQGDDSKAKATPGNSKNEDVEGVYTNEILNGTSIGQFPDIYTEMSQEELRAEADRCRREFLNPEILYMNRKWEEDDRFDNCKKIGNATGSN